MTLKKNGAQLLLKTLRFLVFERMYSQPRRHLGSQSAMQRLSSEAIICPDMMR